MTSRTSDPRYKIDHERKVFVYKNLHKDCWSVRQDGLVKAHADDICLYDCAFRVGKKGRKKVLKEKRKNVHAGITGYIDTFEVDKWDDNHPNTAHAFYNPYKNETFVDSAGDPVFWSSAVKIADRVSYVLCYPEGVELI